VDEFVFLRPRGIWACETAKEINHVASGEGTGPNVAVDNPYYISLCLPVTPTHVPDLRVRPEIVALPIATRKIRVFIFYQNFRIEVWKVSK